ncbi:MAG: EF-Tu/IF-2/RF-3 family GTPase, partial [Paracoccaceae bacterium]
PAAEPDVVIEQTFELFLELGANDDQIEFPIIYASAKNGFAKKNMDDPDVDMVPLLETITEHVPPVPQDNGEFQFQVTSLDYNDYLGRICIGRIFSGNAKVGENVILIGKDDNGNEIKSNHKITKLFTFLGLQRIEAEEARCGDIVAIAGIPEMTIGDTLCSEEKPESLPRIAIEPPTVSMQFWINDSPFAGKEGKFVTSRNIRERLEKELKTNLSLRVEQQGETFQVQGRGELQLAILVENMRREGFELSIARPQVLFREDEAGQRLEPIEEVTIDVDDDYTGAVIEKLTGPRKGEMVDMRPAGAGKTRIMAHVPSRGLIGYHGEFLTDTRGTGVLNRVFHTWAPYKGAIEGRRAGVLISMEDGVSVAYALWNLEERGRMFIGSQVQVYQGMIIGEHSRDNDLEVNPLKGKKLTNVRASGSDEAVRLTPHTQFSLEEAIAYINNDELVEVTPQSIRLRKKYLDPHERKRMSKLS